jgi:hypothetical protein
VASSMLSSWPLTLGTQTTKHTAAPVQTDPDVLAAVVVSVHSGLPQRDVVSTPKHPFGTHAGRRPHPFIASTGSSSLRRDVVPGRPMPGQRAAGGLMVDRLGGRLRGLGRLLGQGPAQVTGGPSTRWRGRSGGSRASSRSYSGGQDIRGEHLRTGVGVLGMANPGQVHRYAHHCGSTRASGCRRVPRSPRWTLARRPAGTASPGGGHVHELARPAGAADRTAD